MSIFESNGVALATDVADNILQQAIICQQSKAPFRIIKPELAFYRQYNLPLPTLHPHSRHEQRLKERASNNLHVRTCDKTGEEILSVYLKDVPFEVYSQPAYEKVVFG